MAKHSYITSADRRYYLDASGAPNVTRLADDALSDLKAIHFSGVGRHQLRSRGLIRKRVRNVLVASGYSADEHAANRWFNSHVLDLFTLWIASDCDE